MRVRRHLILAADGKMRSEIRERIHREIAQRIASGGAAPHGWDPAAPWTACFFAAAFGKLDDKDVRAEQVHQPVAAWSARIRRVCYPRKAKIVAS